MRTTIRMQDQLLREAKKRAAQQNRSLTAFIEEAVREKLLNTAGEEAAEPSPAYRLITFKGEGTRPGIDLDNSASLYDAMDG
ncbi:MAG: ribbon-helix-helix protein, CopG family [Spirochaetota bacterium]|nr:ribbon-helix-helix protein, CopG family [Spirochaetota bacterium]